MPLPPPFWLKLDDVKDPDKVIMQRWARDIPAGTTLIAKKTLTLATASIVISSIPQIYAYLRIVLLARSSVAAVIDTSAINFNGDVGVAHYGEQQMQGVNATSSANNSYAQTGVIGNCPGSTAAANMFGVSDITCYNYTSTVQNKVGFETSGEMTGTPASDVILTRFWFWNQNTTAITSVTATVAGGNLLAGSSLAVYGVF